jgi:hypothetical protein
MLIVVTGLQKPYSKMEVGESCTGGSLLTGDGDDNSYLVMGSKYLEYILSIRITNKKFNNH